MRRLTVIVILTLTLLAVLSAACGKPTLPPPPTLDFSATRAAGGATTPRPTATTAPTTKVTAPQAGNETSTPEIAATRPITTSSAPGTGGWAYRADMMVAMFSLHALNCERQAQGLAPVAYPKDNRLGKELTEAVKQMTTAYVQGKDLDALARKLGVGYLWSNVFAYGADIADKPIGKLVADCSYAEQWAVFKGLDLKEVGSEVATLSIRRETKDGYERRFLVVWKEE